MQDSHDEKAAGILGLSRLPAVVIYMPEPSSPREEPQKLHGAAQGRSRDCTAALQAEPDPAVWSGLAVSQGGTPPPLCSTRPTGTGHRLTSRAHHDGGGQFWEDVDSSAGGTL